MGWNQSCDDGKAARSDAKTINSPQRVMSLCWKCEEGKVCVQLEGGKVKNECSSIENLLRCDNVVQSLDSSSLPNRFLSPHASFWWEGIIKNTESQTLTTSPACVRLFKKDPNARLQTGGIVKAQSELLKTWNMDPENKTTRQQRKQAEANPTKTKHKSKI